MALHGRRSTSVAAKPPETTDPRPIRSLLRRLIKAPAMLSFLWPAILGFGGYFAWRHWGAEHVAKQYFAVDPTLIEITTPPPFIHSDIVQTVYQDTAMEGLSLLDHQATAKIASAFSTHPWVRRVVSVRKLPGGAVDVRVHYRKPVAMVRVRLPDSKKDNYGFFPVDESGIVLPPTDFSSAQTWEFIHINVPEAYATGGAGSAFGDARVEAAAQLAAFLAPYRELAGIASIGVYGDPRVSPPQLEITTKDRQRLPWGSAPGMETKGELSSAMRLKMLLDQLRVKQVADASDETATSR
jgi:hypothetical protein